MTPLRPARVLAALVAIVALLQPLAAGRVLVVSQPPSIAIDTASAGAMPVDNTATLLATVLGLPTPTPLAWQGLTTLDLFTRPHAAALVVVPPAAALSVAAAAVVDTVAPEASHASPLESLVAPGGRSLAATAALVFGADAFSLAVSANPKTALLAGVRGVRGGASYTVAADSTNGFSETRGQSAAGLDLSADELAIQLEAQVFGKDVTIAQNKLSVKLPDGSMGELDLEDPAERAFVAELVAMLVSTERAAALHEKRSPAVFSLVVSTFEALGSNPTTVATARTLIAAFVARLSKIMETRYGTRALVAVAELPSELLVRTRDSIAATPGSNARIELDVPHCVDYEFFCNRNPSNPDNAPPLDPACNCEKCDDQDAINKGEVWCSWNPCGTGATIPANIAKIVTYARCIKCANERTDQDKGPLGEDKDHYILYHGHCYVDSLFPVTFNIVLWLAVALALGMLLTCYALGGMDPGRNSIIYRMTSQRPKMH